MNEKRKFLPEKEDYLTLNKTNYDKRREEVSQKSGVT